MDIARVRRDYHEKANLYSEQNMGENRITTEAKDGPPFVLAWYESRWGLPERRARHACWRRNNAPFYTFCVARRAPVAMKRRYRRKRESQPTEY